MAVGEPRKEGQITQVSWTDGTAQDVYYGQEHSFQYSANINCDDEMHGIKLSNKARFTDVDALKDCQLVSVGEHGVIALKTQLLATPHIFTDDNDSFDAGGTAVGTGKESKPNPNVDVCPGVVFQDSFWYGIIIHDAEAGDVNGLVSWNVTGAGTNTSYCPIDHTDYTDEAISTPVPSNQRKFMQGAISAILSYNNTRLVVACGQELWVYYPELDRQGEVITTGGQSHTILPGETGWKKVLQYEAGVKIVALTCTFEYLKVWAVDEGWNTKVYYYQGNNNLRSTFVYNVVDLTGVRVTRVYSINGIDYYVSSQDGTDGLVNLYKMVGNTPVSLFHQRGGLDPLDVNFKAPYFVGPCSIEAGYTDGTFYIADTYGLFRFKYTPQGYDKGYMKWKFNTNQEQPTGVCFNQGFLYVSTDAGCYKMRAYDTGVDGFQEEGVLISREFEGREGGTVTKMLDEVRLNYELNPLTEQKGTIDVYVSPNNLWKTTRPEDYKNYGEVNTLDDLPDASSHIEQDFFWVKEEGTYYMCIYDEDDEEEHYKWQRQPSWIIPGGWYKVMHIYRENGKTRVEKSNLYNDLEGGSSSFKFDWQTITYAIVIKKTGNTHATPIVRQIDLKYHVKDKTNNVYNIN